MRAASRQLEVTAEIEPEQAVKRSAQKAKQCIGSFLRIAKNYLSLRRDTSESFPRNSWSI
jgi:hypothetical protein